MLTKRAKEPEKTNRKLQHTHRRLLQKKQGKARKIMRRGIRYNPDTDPFYGRRGGDRRRARPYLNIPGMTPGLAPGGLRPVLNPRMSPWNPLQGQLIPPMNDVVRWVLETCGGNLEEATGSMKIRDIPYDFPQFVVHRPTIQLQTSFKERKSRSRPSLMFHGTPVPNLQSILQGGFNPGAIWVAKEPRFSMFFALKGPMIVDRGGRLRESEIGEAARGLPARARGLSSPQIQNLVQSPYVQYGALLGCEYVEDSRFQGRGSSESIPVRAPLEGTARTFDHYAVMVRYVFLIPPGTRGGNLIVLPGVREDGPAFPKRKQIKTQMVQNMENIEARIEGRRRGR
jgi:hypothetical protein